MLIVFFSWECFLVKLNKWRKTIQLDSFVFIKIIMFSNKHYTVILIVQLEQNETNNFCSLPIFPFEYSVVFPSWISSATHSTWNIVYIIHGMWIFILFVSTLLSFDFDKGGCSVLIENHKNFFWRISMVMYID